MSTATNSAVGASHRRQRLLLGLTLAGFLVPNGFVVAYLASHGLDIGGYFRAWVETIPAAQLTADLAICCIAFLTWSRWDAQRHGIDRWWILLPATALVGICFAIPLHLWRREVQRDRQQAVRASGATDPVTIAPGAST